MSRYFLEVSYKGTNYSGFQIQQNAKSIQAEIEKAFCILQKEKIDLIIQYMERNGDMSENYFEQILGGDDAETIDNFVDKNPNDILVFGPNGKTVRASDRRRRRTEVARQGRRSGARAAPGAVVRQARARGEITQKGDYRAAEDRECRGLMGG